jgi:hypothetical protein
MGKAAAESRGARGWWRYRIVLYLAAGLAVFDGVLAANRRVWRAYDPDDYRIKMHECIGRQRDLVLIGGSPVSEGIDPAVLAGTVWHGQPLEDVFNLGLSGATTSEIWHAVRHGIGTPPRLVVYGITASDLNDGRDEPHGPRSLMEAGDVADWVRRRPEAAAWCVRQFAYGKCGRCWNLYQYRNAVRLWAADHIEQTFPGLCPEAAREARDGLRQSAALAAGNGYAPRPVFRTSTLTGLKAAGDFPPFNFLDNYALGGHLRYLHRLLDWAQTNGVALLLLDMPVSADLVRQYPEVFAAYEQAIAEVERTRGVSVLRASRQEVGLGDDEFADLIHLNATGTARLSAWLREHLER